MENNYDFDIRLLMEELDAAVLAGDVETADEKAEILYRLQVWAQEHVDMPENFLLSVANANKTYSGGKNVKPRSFKKFISLAAAAVLVLALGVTAMAADLFGIRALVFSSYDQAADIGPVTNAPTGDIVLEEPEEQDLIVLQGYPDSSEYKASEEWNIFCEGYDRDGSVLSEVGNSSNEFTEKYPMYLVYSQAMADKLEEIVAKYNLMLHKSMKLVQNSEELVAESGTGNFLQATASEFEDTVLGGYVYNDGSFHYDGNAVLSGGVSFPYQFGRYIKGTFSDTYLNVGDADEYAEWEYATSSGVTVNLALGNNKSLVIADLGGSFVTINILTGIEGNDAFSSGSIDENDLHNFADMFDYSLID